MPVPSEDVVVDDMPASRAWIFFVVSGALLGAHAAYLIVLPSVDPLHWRAYTTDPAVLEYLADDFRSSGGMQLALAVLTVVAAATWLRRGDRVAWWMFWTFPLLFLWQAATTWIVPLWLLLALASVVALMLGRPRALGNGQQVPV
jgi:hypothetical protein